ncbi:MAG TPA: hypothetical protein DCQ06_12125 [Myxococcales bacterium]|nr:hypothetical protein [Myxococcales bacterium]HAN32333.1 hypothetical protein [Myxococcales bacterium]
MLSERVKTIFRLALPIIAGMCSQNILNTVDTAFVGSLGQTALGAVGIGGIATWLCLSSLIGLSTAVQAYAARRIGEGLTHRAAVGLKVALMLAIGLGSVLAVAGWFGASQVFAWMVDDVAVQQVGTEYLQVRLAAAPFSVCIFAFSGFYNGIGQSRRYLAVLVIMHSSNVLLDWMLIFGNLGAPALGATGAGLATSLSQVIGFFVYVAMVVRDGRSYGFFTESLTHTDAKNVVKVALPSSLQQGTYSAGFLTIFAIAAAIGTQAVALSHVLVNLMLLCVLPGVGFGIAGATLVGQALGRGDRQQALSWGRDIIRIGVVIMIGLGLILALGGRTWLSIFLRSEPELIEAGIVPLMIIGLSQGLDSIGVMYKQMMMRSGDTAAIFRISTTIQWGLFLPVLWISCTQLGGDVLTLWALLMGWRLLDSSAMILRWRSGRWVEAAQI